MKIGFLNLDNPYSLLSVTFAKAGHTVCAYDENPDLERYFDPEDIFPEFTYTTDLKDAVADSDYVFIVHETKLDEYNDGSYPLRKITGQDYSSLASTFVELNSLLAPEQKVVLIGNVVPTTCKKLQQLIPTNPLMYMVFCTHFDVDKINTRQKFEYQVFQEHQYILLGLNTGLKQDPKFQAFQEDFKVFPQIENGRLTNATWEEAELANMCSRSWDAIHRTYMNSVQQLCSELGADTRCVNFLVRGHIKKNSVWKSGMGFNHDYSQTLCDMSNLTNQLGFGYDMFKETLTAREKQAKHIARKIIEQGTTSYFEEIVYDKHQLDDFFYLGRTPPKYYNSFMKLIQHYFVQFGGTVFEEPRGSEVYVPFPNSKIAKSMKIEGWRGRIFDIQEYYGRPFENDIMDGRTS